MHFVNHDKDWFFACLENKPLIEKLKKISLIISDIDGCLTDGKVYYSSNTEIEKCFSIQDGFMMAKCNQKNMPHLALISGRSDKAAAKRAKILNIPDELYYQGVDKNKSSAVKEIQTKLSVNIEETLFFGDDLLDLETKNSVGLFAAPSNALFYIQDHADIIAPRSGGNGALRTILDLLLYVQNKHIAHKSIETPII
ncbi:HAD hydrolase family protein [Candidatus Dependentiae bacterium]|nr:HAD hydrolase family protein [Candidatus Dependentiae bacterium]